MLDSDSRAQLYEAFRPHVGPQGIYGCTPGAGHTFRLGRTPSCGVTFCDECPTPRDFGCGAVDDELLAGVAVAYREYRREPRSDDQLLSVRNLRTGRFIHRPSIGYEQQLLTVSVKSNGSIAWIQTKNAGYHHGGLGPPVYYSIYAVDTSGFRTLADALPTPPPTLTLSGSRLSWTQSGKPASTILN